MHIRKLSAPKPVRAFNLEAVLDIVLQLIIVLEELEAFLGIDLVSKNQPQ